MHRSSLGGDGFRFSPCDRECIDHLLGSFIKKSLLPSHGFISIADLYGQTEPWELFEDSQKVGAKKGRSYQRYSKDVGAGGNWSNKGQKSDIIGHARTFRYQPRNSDDVGPTRGEWALKEYSFPDSTSLRVDDDRRDYVLCVLKKKKEKTPTTTTTVHPRDCDCIEYLQGFIAGNPLPSHGFISIADIYGQTEPWELSADSQVKDGGCRYFFTKLKKVGAKKGRSYQRYSRNVGCGGHWSNKGQKSDIIGHARTFRYQPRNSDDVGPTHGEWALKEYSHPGSTSLRVDEDRRDYVLCVLKKKKEKTTTTKTTGRGVVQAVEADLGYLRATLAPTSPGKGHVGSLDYPTTGGQVVWPSDIERWLNDDEVLEGDSFDSSDVDNWLHANGFHWSSDLPIIAS
ncbi:NAC domain protein [Striga asiatica]|uniref:NAC domain protein n=1 Tax=Striga asiatica TaxID=4170 RepID=A0A5A7NXC6_STRAF|nr:NAC domain protein [Striga asiatica]